jgi:hypothetical protein
VHGAVHCQGLCHAPAARVVDAVAAVTNFQTSVPIYHIEALQRVL